MQVNAIRTPSGVNGAASVVAHSASNPGPRASTPSNLDSTRTRIVKRGCVVEFPGGATARVVKVRLGAFWASSSAPRYSGYRSESGYSCSSVRVLS